MDQIGKDIEKVIKASIGAVQDGVQKSSEMIEKLAKKGEPLYNQAKSSVCDAAGKLKNAIDNSSLVVSVGKPKVKDVADMLRQFSQEELDEIKEKIDEIYPTRPEKKSESPCENSDGTCNSTNSNCEKDDCTCENQNDCKKD